MQDFLDTRHGYVSAAGVELPVEEQVLIVSCPTLLVHCNRTSVPGSSKNGDPGTRGTTYMAVRASWTEVLALPIPLVPLLQVYFLWM